MFVCANKVTNYSASANQGHSIAIRHGMACLDACPPPSIPALLLVQNLSSKWITPTGNMWPKPDDVKRHHRWLKG